jgi:hypothetical protein
MQPKKLITLFLAVILTCFLAVAIFAVEDDPLTMAVEVSSSTAISTKPDICVKAGDEIKVKITVETTPENVSYYQFRIAYDAKAFAPKMVNGDVVSTSGAAANGETLVVTVDQKTEGVLNVYAFGDKGLLTKGELISVTFVAKDGFDSVDGAIGFKFNNVGFYTKSNKTITNIVVKDGAKVQLHSFGNPAVVQGNCVTEGTTTYTCSKCNYKVVLSSGAVSGHKFDAQKVDAKYLKSAATCTAKAVYFKSCSVCGEKGTETFENGDVLAHTYTAQKAEAKYLKTAATCTAKAVYFKACSACGVASATDTFESGEKLAHKFDKETATDAYKATDATCTAKATYYKSCSVCGEKGTATFESGDLAAHAPEDLIKIEAVAPTCTETGLTEGEKCTKCGATTVEQTTVEAKGHVAGEWVVETEPKIGKEGKQYKACTVCSSIVEEEAIPAKSALPIILIIVAVVVVGGGVGVFFVLKNKKEN